MGLFVGGDCHRGGTYKHALMCCLFGYALAAASCTTQQVTPAEPPSSPAMVRTTRSTPSPLSSSELSALSNNDKFVDKQSPVPQVVNARAEDTELNSARRRACAKLPSLQARYARGEFKDNRTLLLKVPLFIKQEGGRHWVWIVVSSWKDRRIQGILVNRPGDDYKVGDRISASQDDVFDYLIAHSDGTHEGNETGEILLKRESESH